MHLLFRPKGCNAPSQPPPFPPATRETDTIFAFGDAVATTVPRTVVTLGEQKLTFIDEGQAFADIASTVVTLTLKTSYWDGTSETSRSVSRAVSVKSVEPGDDIAVDGDRKATVVLTVQPVGGGALASAQIPAGTSGSSSN